LPQNAIAQNLEAKKLKIKNYEQAIDLIDESLLLCDSLGHESMIAETLLAKSHIYIYHYKNEEALPLIDSVFQIYKDQKDTIGLARVYTEGGGLLEKVGDFVRAQDYLKKALSFAEAQEDTISIINSQIYLGIVFTQVENYEVSIDHYKRVLELGTILKNTTVMIAAKMNLGINYSGQKKYDKAIQSYKEIISMDDADKRSDFIFLPFVNLAYTYFLKEEYTKAIKYGEQALLEIEKNGKNLFYDGQVRYTIANSYIKLGEPEKAEAYLDRICELSTLINSVNTEFNCVYTKKEYYKLTRDFEKSLIFSEEYNDLQDSIYRPELISTFSNYKSKLDLDLKNEEISTLQELNIAEAKLYKRNLNLTFLGALTLFTILTSSFVIFRYRQREIIALEQKKIIESKLSVMQSQMNPHFIFNAFTAVQNFVLKSEKLEAYKYLNKLASLLRQVVTIANDIYVRLNKEVQLLEDYLELETLRFKETLSYTLNIDQELHHLNPLIPSMMIQPHIENAIIHGLSGIKKDGQITITLEKYKKGLKCTIRDNGIGRKASKKISEQHSDLHLNMSSINSKKRLSFLKEIGYDQAEFKINDLETDGKSLGTEVLIYLPFINQE